MASCSSSDHPESSHPYHTDRSHSVSSAEPRGRRRNIFSRFLPANLRQGLLPLPEGARPVIILSPTATTNDHLDAPRSPSPGEYAHYRDNGRGFDVGRDIRVTAPPTRDHTWDANPAAPSAPVSPSEFWDNVTIPLSAYLPAPRNGSPEHRTPPPLSAYTQHRGVPRVWDQPVTTWEPALEPVQNDEPVASGSTLPVPNDSSYWSNIIEQRDPPRRPRLHRRRWGTSIGSSQQSHDLHRSYSCPLSRDTMSTSPIRPVERVPSRSSLDPRRHSQE